MSGSSPHHAGDDHTPGTRPRRRLAARLGERGMQVAYISLWVGLFVLAGVVASGRAFVPFVGQHDDKRHAVLERDPVPPAPAPVARGLAVPAKVVGDQVRPAVDGEYAPMFWAGVNLGSSIPGTQPGSVAATRGDYARWLGQMSDLGVTLLRVYTIHPPGFYEAVRDHNLRHPEHPIHVLHGIWIPEERWYATGDLWDAQLMEEMRVEIRNASGAVHGDAVIPKVPGHAGGRYEADISPWLVGWSFGIEWDPTATRATDRLHAGRRAERGTYVTATPDATPTEQWIARQLDVLAAVEAARGVSVPLTFTNWITTDPLRHPDEALPLEDAVSVDAMHIRATAAWPAGYFASYHAYPYYPDFLRRQPGYRTYRRALDGRRDPYAAYLADLKRHHRGIPVMITEFGQPTSQGCAHLGVLGRDQGCMGERRAAANVADMMRTIRAEGMAGGVVFAWMDEWFKFTWNTIDYEVPGARRAMWRNPLTNEEHFGLVAAEPGTSPLVTVNGDERDWEGVPAIATAADGPVREVRAQHDAEHLYLLLRVTPELWRTERIVIGLDAHEDGNRGLPGTSGAAPEADVAVVIDGGRGRMLHAAWVEALGMRFGGFADPAQSFIPARRADLEPGSGAWVPLRQLLDYPQRIPTTGERTPAVVQDVSWMRWGSSDPRDAGFDDRNMIRGAGEILEVAIPWGMATFSDPSRRRVYELRLDRDPDRQVATRRIDRLGIAVAVGDRPAIDTDGYRWVPWDEVVWHERRKAGWEILRRAYLEAAGPFVVG